MLDPSGVAWPKFRTSLPRTCRAWPARSSPLPPSRAWLARSSSLPSKDLCTRLRSHPVPSCSATEQSDAGRGRKSDHRLSRVGRGWPARSQLTCEMCLPCGWARAGKKWVRRDARATHRTPERFLLIADFCCFCQIFFFSLFISFGVFFLDQEAQIGRGGAM